MRPIPGLRPSPSSPLPLLGRLPPNFRKPILTLLTLITYFPLLAFSQTHVATFMTVTGASMYPLLNTDYDSTTRRDVVLVDLRDPGVKLRRGMVVAFWSPNSPEKLAVKRIIALSGDTITTKPPYPFPTETIPDGHIWVEGENPDSDRWSRDSNYYGPISKSLLVGKIRGVVFPFRRAGWLRWQDWSGSGRVREGVLRGDEGPLLNL